jgi:hypothetical protein
LRSKKIGPRTLGGSTRAGKVEPQMRNYKARGAESKVEPNNDGITPLVALRELLRQLICLLASDHPEDEQIRATIAAVKSTLDAAGLDADDLAEVIAGKTTPISELAAYSDGYQDGRFDTRRAAAADADTGVVDWEPNLLKLTQFCLARGGRLNAKEIDFLETVERMIDRGHTLSPKQKQWLTDIYYKIQRRLKRKQWN